MDGQYSWKREESKEIDLADMLWRMFKQWKRIVICAAAFAVLLGVFGWAKSWVRLKQDNMKKELIREDAVLSEEEERNVLDAVRLENEIRGLETYLDQSVLMKLDPYHKSKTVMLYCINKAKRQELAGITESYLNYILNGGVIDAMEDIGGWQMEKNCLAELITAYQKTYSSPYQVLVNSLSDNIHTESLFYVEVIGENAEMAENLAMKIQSVLKKYSAIVEKSAGSHKLILISSTESITADGGLQSVQHDKRTLLSSNKAALKTMLDTFSQEQTAVYEETVGEKENHNNNETKTYISDEKEFDLNILSKSKYALFGLFGGICLYCGIFVCWYLFCDEVKSTDEMKRMYIFPVFGCFFPENRIPYNSIILSETCKDQYGRTETQILNRIRLVCQKNKITKLCAAAAFSMSLPEKRCLEQMAEKLKEKGIDMAIAENIDVDTDKWDEMVKIENVLMICRMGTTTYRMIDDAMKFFQENHISVVGAAAFFSQGSKTKFGIEKWKSIVY